MIRGGVQFRWLSAGSKKKKDTSATDGTLVGLIAQRLRALVAETQMTARDHDWIARGTQTNDALFRGVRVVELELFDAVNVVNHVERAVVLHDELAVSDTCLKNSMQRRTKIFCLYTFKSTLFSPAFTMLAYVICVVIFFSLVLSAAICCTS